MLKRILELFRNDTGKVQPPQPEPRDEQPAPQPPKKPRQPRRARAEPVLSDKEQATARNEPWVSITRVELDPGNINNGSFELDWNDKFVLNLIKAGYKQRPDDTDQTIVDRWFQTVCRNVALEVYEQQMADPSNRYDELRRVSRRDIGGGRSEIS